MTMPPTDVLQHVIDVHAHPTDSNITEAEIDQLPITVCAMATRHNDQQLVAKLARALPEKIVPCFGLSSMILLFNGSRQYIYHCY